MSRLSSSLQCSWRAGYLLHDNTTTRSLQQAYCTAGTGDLRLGFIGAGGVNFGTPEGPWNHAKRLSNFPGVTFSAIVDPNTALAQDRAAEYASGLHAAKWKDVQVFVSHRAMLDSPNVPDAVFIGLPPEHHGGVSSSNIELELAEAGVHMFVEKPLSVKPPEEVAELSAKLQELQQQKGLMVAVGYQLRYSPAVEAARRILEEHDTPTAAIGGQFVGTYNHIHKRSWWDTAMSGGTMVEQACHFVDLACHLSFGSEIERDSVQATAVGPDYPLADMPSPPHGEHLVPMERRVNRVTSTIWKYRNGTVGSLTHSVLQHEQNFLGTLDILADGLHMIIGDPYGTPSLKLRRRHSNVYEDVPLELGKDMYVLQFEDFLHAVRTGDASRIRCPYQSAALTYQASQWMTIAADRNRTRVDWKKMTG